MLCKADPCLEDDVADDRYPSCSIFLDTAGFMDHHHVLRQAEFFFKEVHATVVALFWQNREGGK
jgi:hypothetical protein